MAPGDLVIALGATLPLLLLVAVVSVVGAIVAGVYMLRARPDPLAMTLPVALPLVVAVVAAAIALNRPDPAEAVGVAAGLRLVAVFFALPAAAIVAVFAAIAGARGAVRQWKPTGAVFALALGTAGVTAWGGIAEEDWLYPSIRAGAYAVMGLLLALSMLGGDEKGPTHPEASAASAGAFGLVVWAGEASGRALETVFLLAVLPGVIPEGRAAYVDQAFHDVIVPAALWHTVSWGLGMLAATAAVGFAWRSSKGAVGPLALLAFTFVVGDRAGNPGIDDLHAVAAAPPVEPAPVP